VPSPPDARVRSLAISVLDRTERCQVGHVFWKRAAAPARPERHVRRASKVRVLAVLAGTAGVVVVAVIGSELICIGLTGGSIGALAGGGTLGAGGTVGAVEVISATGGPSGLAMAGTEIIAGGGTEIAALTSEGGLAIVELGYLGSGIRNLVQSVRVLTGARNVIILSGPIANGPLYNVLLKCAQTGQQFMGGAVWTMRGLSSVPEFIIKF
jgi:hypothetical protein